MHDSDVQIVIWVLFGIAGIVITFYIFGAELPTYLILAISGMIFYIYSENIVLKLVGGTAVRVFSTLFLISLIYYFGTKTFFPDDPLNFRFLKFFVELTIDSFVRTSNFIGKLVLSLVDSIIA